MRDGRRRITPRQHERLRALAAALWAHPAGDGRTSAAWDFRRADQAARRIEARGGRHAALQGLFYAADSYGWVLAESRDELAYLMDLEAVSTEWLRRLADEEGSGVAEVLRLPDPTVEPVPRRGERAFPWIAVRVETPAEPARPIKREYVGKLRPMERRTHAADTWFRPGDWPPPDPARLAAEATGERA